MHTKGKNTGLIQCKWHSNRLERPECIKEIIKFVLYYIIDNSLITEITVQTGDVILMMGARDPSLSDFAVEVLEKL